MDDDNENYTIFEFWDTKKINIGMTSGKDMLDAVCRMSKMYPSVEFGKVEIAN